MPTPDGPLIRREYEARLAVRRAWRAAHNRQHLRLSRVRLAIVLGVLTMAGIWGRGAGWWYAVALVGFTSVAVLHATVLQKRTRAERAVRFYERGLARLDHQWMGAGDSGERYRRRDHPYSEDLDLFGRGSAFELIGTARTRAGQDTIARWLLEGADPDGVRARQAAVRELQPRLNLREALALHDEEVGAGDAERLRRWATAQPALRDSVVRIVLLVLSVGVAAALVAWWVQGTLSAGVARPLAALLAAEAGIAAWRRRPVKAVAGAVESRASDLTLLVRVLRTIERERVTSEALVRLQRALAVDRRRASLEIARLDRLVGMLQARRNPFFALVSVFFAWTTQTALAIEAWRARVGRFVPGWLDAIGEFEALAALAGYAAEHPDASFPEFVEGSPSLEAAALAHPLLPSGAVANDVALGRTAPRLLVVSGSNMSGKSTLLRAVGLNLVLARAGAPVRAARFRSSVLAVGAAIRIEDSLLDGRSRFLAEILKLKQIVDLARAESGAVLFLLDEILGGTNSADRRAGAEAVLDGLMGLGAIGLITTHDLSLGAVAERLGPFAANVHFADEFDGGGLSFDYRLRPGVVRTSNALALMRSIGLNVDEPG